MEFSEAAIRDVMKVVFGFDDFKSPAQKQAVDAVLAGEKNIIVSMAANGGKSFCFQLPVKMQVEGITLVISPTLSHMENQTGYLNSLGLGAVSISSETSYDRRDEIDDEIDDGDVQFIYMTPEMKETPKYSQRIDQLLDDQTITRVVIDEAHCLVDKYLFRCAFDSLGTFRKQHAQVPFIALTTGSEKILREIEEKLEMTAPKIIEGKTDLKNIVYKTVEFGNDQEIDFRDFFTKLDPSTPTLDVGKVPTGIIYCHRYGQFNQIMEKLRELEISATGFHGNLENRFKNYDDWMSDIYPVMVATSESFGLGITKSGIKFVLHCGTPKSLRALYQETGRAGLNIDEAYSFIYYNRDTLRSLRAEDFEINNYIRSPECRHKLLARFFGNCVSDCRKRCDNCLNEFGQHVGQQKRTSREKSDASPSKMIKT